MRLIGAFLIASMGGVASGPASAQADPLAPLPQRVVQQAAPQPTIQPVQTIYTQRVWAAPTGFEAYKQYLAARARSEGDPRSDHPGERDPGLRSQPPRDRARPVPARRTAEQQLHSAVRAVPAAARHPEPDPARPEPLFVDLRQPDPDPRPLRRRSRRADGDLWPRDQLRRGHRRVRPARGARQPGLRRAAPGDVRERVRRRAAS